MQKNEEIVAELGGIAVLGQIENMALRQCILSNQLGYISHGEYHRNGFNPARHIEV